MRARGEFGTKAPSWPMVIDISPTSLTAALLAEEDAEHQRQRERHKLAKVMHIAQPLPTQGLVPSPWGEAALRVPRRRRMPWVTAGVA